ncbi:MAG: hypothetical protein LBR34_08000 [Prevotella sp.]|jgi:hypothetical protein|nr:hypothetical protein [Prevotella sp.]
MKRMIFTWKQQALALVMMCAGFSVNAQTIALTGGAGDITIAAAGELKTAIDALSDKTVVTSLAVSSTAASHMLDATDVAAIQTLTALKTLDFSGITMNNYTLPGGLLYRNPTVETFIFPPNAYRCGNYDFVCTALKGEVTLPAIWNSATYMRPSFWANNPGITAIKGLDGSGALISIDGVVFDKATNTVVYYPGGKTDETYELPATVVGISTAATQPFNYNYHLKKLIFPANFVPAQDASGKYQGTAIVTQGSIEAFEVDAANPNIGSVNGLLYNKNTNAIFYAPPVISTVRIPSPIVRIQGGGSQNSVFGGNSSNSAAYWFDNTAVSDNHTKLITLLDLPATLTHIENGAFVGAENLATIISRATTVPANGKDAWRSIGGSLTPAWSTKVYVPVAALSTYTSSTWVAGSSGNDVDGVSQTGFSGFPVSAFLPFYTLTITNGTASSPLASDIAAENQTVTITADEPEEGKVFDKWVALSGISDADLDDAESPTAEFVMPAGDVALEATYKEDIQNGFAASAINETPVAVRYYTVQGIEVKTPAANGLYIVKKIYASKKAKVSKVIYTNQ